MNMQKFKVVWQKDSEKLVDEDVKQDIENQVQERTDEIFKIQKFLKELDESLSCHVAFPISDYGRKGDREGGFELVCMFEEVWINYETGYTKTSCLKDEVISQMVAIVEKLNDGRAKRKEDKTDQNKEESK